MSSLIRFFSYSAAFVMPPVVAAALGFHTLRVRERPAPLPSIDARAAIDAPRAAIDPAKPTVVVVLGTDITEITDALGPYEMFARVGRYNVVTVAARRQPTLLTGGLRILPHYSLSELDARLGGRAPEVVVVPNLPNADAPQNASTIDWLRQKAEAGSLMHSWCKGAMALAQTGLLDGEIATAHWGDIPSLEKRYPMVRWTRGVRWVEHGQFVMSAGITSGIDASLRLIIRLAGDSAARRVAREIRYPDYRYALDPAAPQYELRPADLVLLANAAYRVNRPQIGVAMYDGIGELDLSNIYDAHAHTMVAEVETVAERDGIVQTAHGLTLLPSLAVSAAGGAERARRLDRMMIPGAEARARGASLVTALTALTPALRAEYVHADQPQRFGLEPVLEDLARSSDLPTARFAQRRMEYRSSNVRLEGSGVAWRALVPALALGALGILLAMAIVHLISRRRLLTLGVGLLIVAPSAVRAQSLDSIASGTRIRADVFTSELWRGRRAAAQPVAGDLLGLRGDTLLLSVREGADALRIPRSVVREVYVSGGRPSRMTSAVRSAWVPAIAGAALRGLVVGVRRRDGDPSIGQAALSGAVTSAIFAAVKGALFPKERWRRVDGPAK